MNTCFECGGYNGINYCYRTQNLRIPNHPACKQFTPLPDHLMKERIEERT